MFEENIAVFLDTIQEDNSKDIIKLISNLNLKFLTEDYQKRIDPKNVMPCKILKLRQKAKYQLFIAAIKEFLLECEKHDLKPVFLKGVFLAVDLYEEIETRSSNDIDILIDIEEFPLYYEILNRLGYVYEYYTEETDYYEFYYNELQERHLGYIKRVNNQIICIEVHSVLINASSLFVNTADEFLKNSRQIESLGMKPYVLDLEHNLVQLLIHFFKHLTEYYFQNMLFQREIYVNISNLHDIALYMDKYKDEIDMNKVIEIAKRMMIVKYVELVMILVNKIYGELFSPDCLFLFSSNEEYSRMGILDSQKNGFGKMVWLLDIYVDYCKDLTPKQFVLGMMPEEFRLIDIALCERSKALTVKTGENTEIEEFYEFPMHTDGKQENVKTRLHISVNSDFLEIQYDVANKICCCYESETDECYKKDSIEIIVIKNNYVVHRMLTVSMKQNEYSMVLYSDNTGSVIDLALTEVKYNLNIYDNGFQIQLKVPWSFMDINPDIDRIVPFNVAGLVSDPDTSTQHKACNLFNKDELIWNFRDICGIEFKS